MDDGNRLENLIGEDLDPKWNEPSTRGDLRLLAIRIDTKFDQIHRDFQNFSIGIDNKFVGIDNQLVGIDNQLVGIDNKFVGIDNKFDQFRVELVSAMYRAGAIFFGAIVTANLAMFGIFAALIK